MNSAELYEHVSAMGTSELERLVQKLVKVHIDHDPEAAAFLQSAELISTGLHQAAADAGVATAAITEPTDKTEALRAIVLQLAEEPHQAAVIGDMLATARPQRIDPVTASVVLAGIVLVLSTRFDISYDNVNGKRQLHIKVSKEPTSKKLLSKFFDLFK
ncbi:MAG TPA: hypothetical protein VGD37_43740 [Kofleriaceae bacterium]|jgi:hypothetical protein